MEELGAGGCWRNGRCMQRSKRAIQIPFKPEKINALLGTDLSKEEMLAYLAKVELTYDEKTNEIVAPDFPSGISTMWQMLQKKLHVSSDMTRFRQLCHQVKLLQEKIPFKLRIENSSTRYR